MKIIGIPITEVVAFLGLLTTVSGGIMYLFKKIIISPLSDDIQDLNKAMNNLTKQLKELESVDKVLQDQINELKLELSSKSSAYEERFRNIFKKLGG